MIPKSESASALSSIAAHLGIVADELELVTGESERLLVLDALVDLADAIVRGLSHETGRELFAARIREMRMERAIYWKRARRVAS